MIFKIDIKPKRIRNRAARLKIVNGKWKLYTKRIKKDVNV
jgi:chromosome segregation and condensation protein ScpB